MVRRKANKKNLFIQFLTDKILTSKALPLICVFSFLGIMFVFTRMKGIEQDYKYNDLAKRMKVQRIQNKELKAARASELSIKKLKSFAHKFSLIRPDEKRIIIIP